MMLGSNAREDQCRVCEGDGTTCNTMHGLLDMQDLQVGTFDIYFADLELSISKPNPIYIFIRSPIQIL